jgi:HSP20 family protein
LYEPFRELRELSRLQNEVNRLFESFFGKRPFSARAGVFPPINISEDDDNIYATTELPGVAAKDIDIVVEEDSLAIKGVRRIEAAEEAVSYHRKEREAGAFNRKVSLPTRVAAESAHADTNDGVLTVVLPKAAEVKPRKIEIKID